MRLLASGLCLALLLSGCFGGNGDGDGEDSADQTRDPVPVAHPPGCDPTRTALAHHTDGRPAASSLSIVPCMGKIGTASFEPTLGITSDGAVYMYPAAPLGLPETVNVARSADQGASWDLIAPGAGGVPTHPYSQDPYLYVDPVTDRIFAEDLLLVPPPCGMMSFSDDGGDTWTTAQSGCAVLDHVTIFSGPAKTTPLVGYPHLVHRCAISGGALAGLSSMVACQRSADGGLTWLPPGEPAFTFVPGAATGVAPSEGPLAACFGGNGHGVTDADGTVYLPRGHCGQPWLAISEDEGLTWETVQVSELGNACDPSGLCEHDAGLAVDADGTVYYSWVTGDRWLMLTHSTDGGHTWSDPLNITAPGLNEVGLVQMTAGGAGKLALAYYGTSTSPRGNFDAGDYEDTTWDAYMAVILDATSPDPTIHSVPVNPPGDPLIRGVCGPLRCGASFDFIDVRIAPDGTPWAPFVDGCLDACIGGEPEDGSEGLTGRLWNGPSLWDEADANGPYP
ncbi:MAG TPA: exo-alpha-sialidase [Candidatus Thermoplasmatota archaeon]|nr:exo-alpha-sialidase [Candidatus Thermoplasmatota archaeon]